MPLVNFVGITLSVALGVISIPTQNNVLCLFIIPETTESGKKYQITLDDISAAVSLLCKVQVCPVPSACCKRSI
jgi:hypothetical protein